MPVTNMNEPQQLELPQERPESADLLGYWRAIAKHKWAILGLALAVALLTSLVMSSIKPTYRATATALVEPNQNRIVSIEEAYSNVGAGREYLQTQAAIIKSSEIMEKVVAKLRLTTHPEFDPRQQEPPYWHKWLESIGIDPAQVGLEQVRPTVVDEAALAKRVAGAVGARVAVDQVRGSQLVRVSVTAYDPQLAATVANTVVETYIENDLEARYQMTRKASDWLSVRLSGLRQKVEASERALQEFREKERIVEAKGASGGGGTKGQFDELTRLQLEMRQRRSEAEIRYNQIKGVRGDYETVPAIVNNPIFSRARDAELEAEKRLAELRTRYGKEHPRMIAAEAELKAAREASRRAVETVLAGITREYEVTRANEAAIDKTLAQAMNEVENTNRKEFQLNLLEREVAGNRQIYDLFLGRLKETRVGGGDLSRTVARTIEPAVPNLAPFKPDKKRAIQTALIAALFAGMLLALLVEHLDNTIKTSGEVEGKLGLPVLAALPIITGKFKPERHFVENPHSMYAEAIRTARTGILLSAIDEPHKAIVVSSSVPGEGKTTVALNLAYAFAQTKRVVLVDADMRRPHIGRVFGKESTAPGLSNLVSGTSPAQECMFRVDESELYVLPAGVVPPNPLELLLSKRFEDTLHKLMDMFDMVIIDSPPVQLVSDAVVIARRCTGLVYVVKADDVPYQVARNGIKRVRQSLVNIIGVALNQLDFERADRYYGEYTGYAKYGYRRYYGSYGGKKRKQAA